MQQNLLLDYMPIQHDLFGGLASILGCPGLLKAANHGRLTFLTSSRSQRSNFQVGSLSKAWATQNFGKTTKNVLLFVHTM